MHIFLFLLDREDRNWRPQTREGQSGFTVIILLLLPNNEYVVKYNSKTNNATQIDRVERKSCRIDDQNCEWQRSACIALSLPIYIRVRRQSSELIGIEGSSDTRKFRYSNTLQFIIYSV